MDGQVTGYEINHELQAYKQFYGIYTRDTLPKALDRPSGIVVNLDTIKGEGTHWVAIYFTEHGVEYFDPLGFPPTKSDIIEFLITHTEEDILFNSYPVQDLNSSSCGLFCVYFLERRFSGWSYCSILSSFASTPIINELLV